LAETNGEEGDTYLAIPLDILNGNGHSKSVPSQGSDKWLFIAKCQANTRLDIPPRQNSPIS